MLKSHRIQSFLLTLLVIFAGIAVYYTGVSFLDLMELKTIDLRFQARGEKDPQSTVVIAAVDEKSIDEQGKWVWPRRKFADLVARLSDAGVRAIAFDIGFIDEAPSADWDEIAAIRKNLHKNGLDNNQAAFCIREIINLFDADQQLTDAFEASDTPIVLGYFFQVDRHQAAHIPAPEIERQLRNVQTSRIRQVRYASEAAFHAPFMEVAVPNAPVPGVAEAAPYSGFFNMMPDMDGVVRWMPGTLRLREGFYANLSLMTLSAYHASPLIFHVGDNGAIGYQIGDLFIPTDELGRIMINYRGANQTFPHISVTDILEDRVPAEQLKDKIVIVGVTAVGVFDLRVTPFDNVFTGVEVHANIIDSALTGDFLHHPAWGFLWGAAAMLTAGFLAGTAVFRLNVIAAGLLVAGLLGGYICLCGFLFSQYGIVLNIVYPAVVIVIVYISTSALRYLREERQKRFIRNAFSTYLSPSVVKQLIESPDKLALGGEKREITAFFSDVEGFTSISERLSPEALVELLNEFLTETTEILLAHKGTVDKFEGDAIIAMFGAPLSLDHHADAACRASIEMQKRLDVLRGKWENEKHFTIRMRIGMCSGPAVVGNMGSKNRMDYTMMGDTVNTAARLEGINKYYGTYTMISQSTRENLGADILTRRVDITNVDGKNEPVTIYELVGFREDTDAGTAQAISAYEKGFDAYLSRQWDKAIEFFNAVLSINPEDRASRLMIERCRAYQSEPPPDGWSGAFIMHSK